MDDARPTPLIEDIDGTRRKLESWISSNRGRDVRIEELSIPEATGMSNVTLLFDITWNEDGQQRSEPLVARLQPAIERPVFPDYDLSLQYEVMDAVGRCSDIPVPELSGLETDKSLLGVQFYLMKRTDGRIPTDMPPYNMDGWMMHETSIEQRQHLWRTSVDTMARYHQLDYLEMGFGKLLVPGKTPLQQQLVYWRNYLNWALEGAGHDIAQRALDCRPTNQRRNPLYCAGVTPAWVILSLNRRWTVSPLCWTGRWQFWAIQCRIWRGSIILTLRSPRDWECRDWKDCQLMSKRLLNGSKPRVFQPVTMSTIKFLPGCALDLLCPALCWPQGRTVKYKIVSPASYWRNIWTVLSEPPLR